MVEQAITVSPNDRFYDRKLSPWGHSRALAVGSILPKDWSIVRVRKTKESKERIVLDIERIR